MRPSPTSVSLFNLSTLKERVYFDRQNGLIYRHWHPQRKKSDDVRAVEQLVLPTQCRPLVLRLAHDIPTAGHLGINKTQKQILQRYYWPGVFKDVTNYCRSCEIRQRSQGRRPAKVPMMPMPLIQKSFSQIAMDIVGPLPKTKRGNCYILFVRKILPPAIVSR